MKVLQWNCQSVNSNKTDLLLLIKTYKPDIIILNETRFKPGFEGQLHNYIGIFSSLPEGYAGIALYIKLNIKFIQKNLDNLKIFNNRFQHLCIEIDNLNILALYIPPDITVSERMWRIVFEEVKDTFLVCGDLNAYSPFWGCSSDNGNGRRLGKLYLNWMV